jgi:hypothetical protein
VAHTRALVVEAVGPAVSGCWVLGAVVIHYDVGIRHYASTSPEARTCTCGPGGAINRAAHARIAGASSRTPRGTSPGAGSDWQPTIRSERENSPLPEDQADVTGQRRALARPPVYGDAQQGAAVHDDHGEPGQVVLCDRDAALEEQWPGWPGTPYPTAGTKHPMTTRRSPVLETATSSHSSGPRSFDRSSMTWPPHALVTRPTVPVMPVPGAGGMPQASRRGGAAQ